MGEARAAGARRLHDHVLRLTGLWFGYNVDLVLDAGGARAQQTTHVRDDAGACVSKDLPGRYIFLVGDAAHLEDPPWPEIALAAPTAHWGLGSGTGSVREEWTLPAAGVPRGTRAPSPSRCSTWNIRGLPVRSPEHSRPGTR